ncbi:hypothetical protein H8923_00755 [Romboutsia hominis]|uniref:Uncharacterized protein n=1 Tax=Romboutsia faecis TaxID=2764597 RepID=A0ABR7JK21_9FIRM|nr:hypothetical protein [Romboutsia faecis]MBC5995275.1 hypothetical protein [Romboutsia faecis]
MTELNAQKILCDLGYDNIDKLIKESIEISFNKLKYKFRAFSILEGQLSLNKLNLSEYNENPFIKFVYLPENKVATIDTFAEYDVRKIISNNIDISKMVESDNELGIYRMKKELCGMNDMLIEYMTVTDHIKEEIVNYILSKI